MKTNSKTRIVDRLRHKDVSVRLDAMGRLLAQPSCASAYTPLLAERIDDPNGVVRQMAADLLGAAGPVAVPALERGLSERQPTVVRIKSAASLARIGSGSAPATEALVACLDSEDKDLRWHASFALGKTGASAVPALLAKISASRRGDVRLACIDALGWIGAAAKTTVWVLETLAKAASSSSNPKENQLGCWSAIARITGKAKPAVKALVRSLDEESPALRAAAIDRIGELGPAARGAEATVLARTDDPAQEVRSASILALVKLEVDAKTAVPVLTRLLDDPSPSVRSSAAIALHSFGPAASQALGALGRRTNDGDRRVAAIIRAAIENISGQRAREQGVDRHATSTRRAG